MAKDEKQKDEQGVCPHCGYCPHCGRANDDGEKVRFVPVPYPVPQPYPVPAIPAPRPWPYWTPPARWQVEYPPTIVYSTNTLSAPEGNYTVWNHGSVSVSEA